MTEHVYQITDFGFNYPFSAQKIHLTGTFEINAGDFVLIQGASGSGKSTLLAALKGLIPHLVSGTLTGKIIYNNHDITQLTAQDLLTIGYLQQNPESQIICTNVFDELAFGLENQQLSADVIKKKILALTNKFQLNHLLTRKTATLSGGERQKISLIAILLLEPKVLLLDEPTAFLDPHSANEIMKILAEYATKTTIIIIEHNINYVKNMVNRVMQIDCRGVIREIAPQHIAWNPAIPLQSCKHNMLSDNQPILSCKQLSFAYPQSSQMTLHNITFALRSGEIIAIRGKNGSGKSTLLKLIAQLLPSKNMLYTQNQPLEKLKNKWQLISLLWQNPEAHFLYNSVAEELKNNADDSKFDLVNQARQNPFNLSEGQKRRLSLAIVLQAKPAIILLDEPTFGQDYENKLRLAQIISDLSKQGISFVMVSHDDNFIQATAHTVFELSQGNLIQCAN